MFLCTFLSLDKLLAFGKEVRKKRVGASPLNPARHCRAGKPLRMESSAFQGAA
jgi:hypothetical protein